MGAYEKGKRVEEKENYLKTLDKRIEALEDIKMIKQYLLMKQEREALRRKLIRFKNLRYSDKTNQLYEALSYSTSQDGTWEKNTQLRCQIDLDTLIIRALLTVQMREDKYIFMEELDAYRKVVRDRLQEEIVYSDDPFTTIDGFDVPIYLEPSCHDVEWSNDGTQLFNYINYEQNKGASVFQSAAGRYCIFLKQEADIEQLEEKYGFDTFSCEREKQAFTSKEVQELLHVRFEKAKIAVKK